MPQRPITLTIKVLIEPGLEPPERTTQYVVSAHKAAGRNIRDGAVVISIYDSDGKLVGVDMSGSPSKDVQTEFENLMEDLEERGQSRPEG